MVSGVKNTSVLQAERDCGLLWPRCRWIVVVAVFGLVILGLGMAVLRYVPGDGVPWTWIVQGDQRGRRDRQTHLVLSSRLQAIVVQTPFHGGGITRSGLCPRLPQRRVASLEDARRIDIDLWSPICMAQPRADCDAGAAPSRQE